MKRVMQTTFGGPDSPPAERGNCDLACLSTITGIPLEQIPRYNELSLDDWHAKRHDFLREHGLIAIPAELSWRENPAYRYLFPDGPCIAVGKSPRGSWNHAVVGILQGCELILVHDPHPSGEFLEGEVKFVEIIYRLHKTEPLEARFTWSRTNGYDVTGRGDRRFSAFFARLQDGRSIEEHYQCDVKGYDPGGRNWKLGKGKKPLRDVNLWAEYLKLWRTWAADHPALIYELRAVVASRGYVLRDRFATTEVNQAHALAAILNGEES